MKDMDHEYRFLRNDSFLDRLDDKDEETFKELLDAMEKETKGKLKRADSLGRVRIDETKSIVRKIIANSGEKVLIPFPFRNPSKNQSELEHAKKRLVEFQGHFERLEKDVLVISQEGREAKIWMIPETLRDPDLILTPEAEIHVFGIRVEESQDFVAISIMRADEAACLPNVEPDYKIILAMGYLRLSKEKRNRILAMGKPGAGKTENEEKTAEDRVFRTFSEWRVRYQMTKESYPAETRSSIETLLEEATNSKAHEKLQYLMNICPVAVEKRPVLKSDILPYLDKRLYGLEAEKRMIRDMLVSNERAGSHGFNILITGPSGVGKTELAKCVAEVSGLPSEIIPLSGISTVIDLQGLNSDYNNADVSRITKAFYKYGTSEIVCILEAIDKMNTSSEGDPRNVLYGILCGEYEDRFLETRVPTENTIYIATADDPASVPEAIRKRFQCIITLKEKTEKEKTEIAKNYLLPKLRERFDVDPAQFSVPVPVLHSIMKNFCGDSGVRDLKNNLELILRKRIGERLLKKKPVTEKEAEEVLSPMVDETSYMLRFNRKKEFYSEPVKNEIRKLVKMVKEDNTLSNKKQSAQLAKEKLEYLLLLDQKEQAPQAFDPDAFYEKLRKTHYGMEPVMNEVASFYYLRSISANVLNSNLALSGGMGVGKSSICRSIAEAMGYHFCRISLNGVRDPGEISGYPETFQNSGPGKIMRGIKEAGGLRTVFQLDELDKLPHELSYALIDILDREYTDRYFGIPVELKGCIFIATCNDWGLVDPVIRDRFTRVEVEGYTKKDKKTILEDYIIPKICRTYVAKKVTVDLDEKAEKLLLDSYCLSFGVRDLEKAAERLIGTKLRENAGDPEGGNVTVSVDDVTRILGAKPIPGGNFPDGEALPGVTRALAVTETNAGATFAVETVLIPAAMEGREVLHITGLPKESALDSVRLAESLARRMYPELFTGKEICLHFAEGAVPKDGPSAGVAVFMSILSAAMEKPIQDQEKYDIAFTGEIDLLGGIYAVGGVMQKIQAADTAGCRKVFIPRQNYEYMGAEKFEQFDCEVIPVSRITEVTGMLLG